MTQSIQSEEQRTYIAPNRSDQSGSALMVSDSARRGRANGASPTTNLARGLGWFSIGLGLTELLAPRQLARGIGVDNRYVPLLPLLGVRELVSGIGILSQKGKSVGWVRSRLVGDAMDLGLLGSAFVSSRSDRTKLAVATAAVVGVTALDVLCSTGARAAVLARGPRRVVRSIAIQRPAAELYGVWRKLENLPRVMSHIASIETRADNVSHWVVSAPAGMTIEWDAQIVDDVPNEKLSWRALPSSPIAHRGSVTFTALGEKRGTLVRVQLDYDPPAGELGQALLTFLGQAPEQRIGNDLRRWKQALETGEIATTEGQSHGRRSLISRALP